MNLKAQQAPVSRGISNVAGNANPTGTKAQSFILRANESLGFNRDMIAGIEANLARVIDERFCLAQGVENTPAPPVPPREDSLPAILAALAEQREQLITINSHTNTILDAL